MPITKREITAAKALLKAQGITTINLTLTDYDEVRVCPKGKGEATAYYASDVRDAIDTALTMVRGTTQEVK